MVVLLRQRHEKSVGKISWRRFASQLRRGREKRGKDKEIFSMPTVEKSVDPRVKRTRKLLQQAFLELFQEKGFASISIQDITERATVNRATFYAHFSDKYALLDSIIREQFQHSVAERLPPPPRGGEQARHSPIRP